MDKNLLLLAASALAGNNMPDVIIPRHQSGVHYKLPLTHKQKRARARATMQKKSRKINQKK